MQTFTGLYLPRPASRSVYEPVGFFVTDELFGIRIPLQVPLQLEADVPEMTDRRHTMCVFDIAERTPSVNDAIDAVLDEDTAAHSAHTGTWDINDPTPAPAGTNGLYEYVRPSASSKSEMMVYLTNAFNALKHLETDPPIGMDQQDIQDMEDSINDWVVNGLANSQLN